jgi:uncharacterized lipoprotein YbaY
MRILPTRAVWGIAAAAFVLLAGCSSDSAAPTEPVVYHALYPSYSDSAELLEKADLVIRGVPISSRVEEMFMDVSEGDDPMTNPQAGLSPAEVEQVRKDSAMVVTVFTVRVDEVVKGRASVGSTVEISQLGGTFGGVRYKADATTMLSPDGTDYVLFLADHGSGKPFDLLNPDQAMYTVAANGTLTRANGTADTLGVKNLPTFKRQASAIN